MGYLRNAKQSCSSAHIASTTAHLSAAASARLVSQDANDNVHEPAGTIAETRQQRRLLNLHLAANQDEATSAMENIKLLDRMATLKLELKIADRGAAENIDKALRVLELFVWGLEEIDPGLLK